MLFLQAKRDSYSQALAERDEVQRRIAFLEEEWRCERAEDTLRLLDRDYARLAAIEGTLARLLHKL